MCDSTSTDVSSNSESKNFNFKDSRIKGHLDDPGHSNNSQIKNFILSLALCHTVIVTSDADGKNTYSASSPDEEALVNAARILGVEFALRDDQGVVTVRNKLVKGPIQE